MSFYQFHYDATIFSKLPFIRKFVGYGYRDSTKTFKMGFLCEVTEVDYIKIYQQLKGDTKTPATIVAKDKVYVLPKCKIPGFKLKEYLKSVGATQTSKIEEATKIIGHDNTESKTIFSNSALIRNIHQYYDVNDVKNYDGKHYRRSIADIQKLISEIDINKLTTLETQPHETILDFCFRDILGWGISQSNNRFFITPTCAMILYYKMLNKIPVVNEDSVFESIKKPLIIDQETYQSLSNMLSSSDATNQLTAIEIISNSDINQSLYYLWKLIKEHGGVMANFRKNKNFRLFKEQINFGVMSCRSERTMLPFLEKAGVLTPEIYKELMTEIHRIYKRTHRSELFDITLTPSEKYKKYAEGAIYEVPSTKDIVEEIIP